MRLPVAGRRWSSTALAKFLLLVVLGGTCGYCYHQDVADRRREIAAATPIEPSGAEAFPVSIAPDWPLWGDIILWVVLLGVFFGVYELLGAGIGRVISRVRE